MSFKNILKRFLTSLVQTPAYCRFVKKNRRDYFNIFTHMTRNERLLLYKLSLLLPKKSVLVEIGSYLGASSVFLASAATERNSLLYCIDTWKNDAMTEGTRDTFVEFLRNTEPLKAAIRPLRDKSENIAKTFNESIDLLFLDGDHSYEAVKTDTELWLPKIKNGGIIIFHDYGWAAGVKRAVNELVKPLQIEEHVVDNTYWARIGTNESDKCFRDNSNS